MPPRQLGTQQIVAVGRLDRQKGFDILLRAFARIAAKAPGWHLTVYEEGDMRDALIALRDSPQVQDRVTFLGVTNEIDEVLARAEFFVLSSRYEGFPDALLEALACGVATLSFDRRSGPAEIVTDGVNGVRVAAGDEMALADTMLTLIGEPERRARLGDAAARSMEHCDRNRVMDGWELLLPATADMCGAEIHRK
jgi:glycosyltransferase involved in cell wall biosynthesis